MQSSGMSMINVRVDGADLERDNRHIFQVQEVNRCYNFKLEIPLWRIADDAKFMFVNASPPPSSSPSESSWENHALVFATARNEKSVQIQIVVSDERKGTSCDGDSNEADEAWSISLWPNLKLEQILK